MYEYIIPHVNMSMSIVFLLSISITPFFLFFFLMIRPPPRSPLFPYTPLSRSDLARRRHEVLPHRDRVRHRRHVEPAEPLDRRVQPTPRLVCDQGRDFRADRDTEVVQIGRAHV